MRGPDGHSKRSASIGSSRDALRAGHIPSRRRPPPSPGGERDHVPVDHRRHVEVRRELPGDRQAECDTDRATGERQGERIGEELAEDVLRPRADRQPHSDLAGPLGHADQHDVHDADPADHQRHHHDRREQRGQDADALLLRCTISDQLRTLRSSSIPTASRWRSRRESRSRAAAGPAQARTSPACTAARAPRAPRAPWRSPARSGRLPVSTGPRARPATPHGRSKLRALPRIAANPLDELECGLRVDRGPSTGETWRLGESL